MSHKGTDIRPYAVIRILGFHITCLIDSGATNSLVGSQGIKLLETLKLVLTPATTTTISTADSTKHEISGTYNAPVEFNNDSKVIRFLAAPTLDCCFVLGVDFWAQFELRLCLKNGSWSCARLTVDSPQASIAQSDVKTVSSNSENQNIEVDSGSLTDEPNTSHIPTEAVLEPTNTIVDEESEVECKQSTHEQNIVGYTVKTKTETVDFASTCNGNTPAEEESIHMKIVKSQYPYTVPGSEDRYKKYYDRHKPYTIASPSNEFQRHDRQSFKAQCISVHLNSEIVKSIGIRTCQSTSYCVTISNSDQLANRLAKDLLAE